MVTQGLLFGFRLHAAPHMVDIGEAEPKRGNFKLPIVIGFFRFGLRVHFASPSRQFSWGDLSQKAPRKARMGRL